MKETKIEFLLKKILYYQMGGRKLWPKFVQWLDDEYEKECVPKSEVIVHQDVEPQEEIDDVAPLTPAEKNKLAAHRLLKKLEKYGFKSITISACKNNKLIADDTEGENFFSYLVKEKFGCIERNVLPNKKMSVKFVFNKETRDKYYGERKG